MRILLVEDHVELSRWVARALEKSHYTVERSLNGADADARLATERYDLVILDLSLARMDGLEVLRRLRARGSRTPVLIVTARAEVSDRVRGLDLGADDYLAKPFEIDELEARIRALLRRSQAGGETRPACGDLVLDPAEPRVRARAARLLNLTPRESRRAGVARCCAPGKVVAKDQLHGRLFPLESEAKADAIEVYVHRLRRKLDGAARAHRHPARAGLPARGGEAVSAGKTARGLQSRLLWWLLPSLALLVAVNSVSTYRTALAAVNTAYDRSLLAVARAVADRVDLRDGRVAVEVPYIALDFFESDLRGRVYYRVGRPRRRRRLRLRRPAAPAPRRSALRGLLRARPLLHGRVPRRARADRRPAPARPRRAHPRDGPHPGGRNAGVARGPDARSSWSTRCARQLLLVALAALVIVVVVRTAFRPLVRLRARARRARRRATSPPSRPVTSPARSTRSWPA